MHLTGQIAAIAFITLTATFTPPCSFAQTPDSQPQLPWMMVDGPPVVYEDSGRGPLPSQSDKPLLAPKLQKEIDQGRTALLSSQFEKASTDFQNAYRFAPGNPEVNFLLGVSFMALEELPEADTYLSRAYSLYPHDPATLTAIGVLRLKQSKFASAVSSLRAAIGLNSRMYLPHLALASALLAENHFADSLQEARTALKMGKQEATEAKFIAGEALAGLGRNEAALKPLQEFVKESPDDPAVGDAKKLMGSLTAKTVTTEARTATQ